MEKARGGVIAAVHVTIRLVAAETGAATAVAATPAHQQEDKNNHQGQKKAKWCSASIMLP